MQTTTVPHNHPYISSLKPQIASNCSYLCGDGYVGRWYLFMAHGAVVTTCTFIILSLFAYFFCLYHPYILLSSLEIFFVLLVCPFLAVLQIKLVMYSVFSSLFQSRPIFLYNILSILIYFSSNLFFFVPSSSFFSYLPPCQHFSTLPPSTLSYRAPSLYLLKTYCPVS